jgi:hypothetical protein
MAEGSNLGRFGGKLWCNNHPQNQQSQPNPTQTIEATRGSTELLLIFYALPEHAETNAKSLKSSTSRQTSRTSNDANPSISSHDNTPHIS